MRTRWSTRAPVSAPALVALAWVEPALVALALVALAWVEPASVVLVLVVVV